MKSFVRIVLFCAVFPVLVLTAGAAIILPAAPDGGKQIVSNEVASVLQHDPQFLGNASADSPAISDPHRFYYVDPKDIISGSWLARAQPGSWRYLLSRGTEIVGEATLIDTPNAGLRAGGVSSTHFASKTRIALQKIQDSGRLQNQDYELRYLVIAPLHFVAVWLHSETDDVIIPLPPTWNRMKDYQSCTENEVTQLLRPDARRLQEFTADETDGRDPVATISVLNAFDRLDPSPTAATTLDSDSDRSRGISVGIGLLIF